MLIVLFLFFSSVCGHTNDNLMRNVSVLSHVTQTSGYKRQRNDIKHNIVRTGGNEDIVPRSITLTAI